MTVPAPTVGENGDGVFGVGSLVPGATAPARGAPSRGARTDGGLDRAVGLASAAPRPMGCRDACGYSNSTGVNR